MTPILLYKADTLGNVICPACKAELEVEEDKLYLFDIEIVECGVCEHKFYLTIHIKTTYEVSPLQHAEPIPIKVKRIMPPERAIPTLIENGWRFNQFGQMENGVRPFILPGAYQMMGCTLEEAEKYEMCWPSCIVEEVEDDE